MTFINLSYLVYRAKKAFNNFPTPIIFAFLAVCVSIYYVEIEQSIDNKFTFINLMLTFYLGIPLSFCSIIIRPQGNTSKLSKYTPDIISVFILLFIYFSLPNRETTFNTQIPYIKYGVFNIIAHLFVSFAFFIKKGYINGFWNYNKTLFIRFCTAVLYSTFLFLGVVFGLSAIDLLFEINISGKLYFQLFIFIYGLINTWYFVAGISKNITVYNSVYIYPRGLKLFTQYVLLPLLCIYLLILYAYGIKILINKNLPITLVSYLAIIVCILGTLTFILLYPYVKQKGNAWMKTAKKYYHYLIYPILFLLILAISIRIYNYGVTINRYLICLFGLWGLIINTSFSFKLTNIKFIPFSLCILLLVSSVGPWGMFKVSERSQSKRLTKILKNHQFLKDGKLINEVIWEKDSLPKFYSVNKYINTPKVNDSIHDEIESILTYLDNYHGMNSIASLYKQNLKKYLTVAAKSNKYISESRTYMNTIGLNYPPNYKPAIETKHNNFSIKKDKVLRISPYDYLTHFNINNKTNISDFNIENTQYNLKFINNGCNLFMYSHTDTLVFHLQDFIQNLYNKYPIKKDSVNGKDTRLEGYVDNYKVLVQIENINLQQNNDSLTSPTLKGLVLLQNIKN